jgi:hypothetical protein
LKACAAFCVLTVIEHYHVDLVSIIKSASGEQNEKNVRE